MKYIILLLFISIMLVLNTPQGTEALAGPSVYAITLTGTSAEVNGGTALSYTPTESPVRIHQITVHSDETETATIGLKIDSAQGTLYDCVADTITMTTAYGFYNEGKSSILLYAGNPYTVKDSLVFDGASIAGNCYITILVEPIKAP